jgi:hypothetical protein
MSQSWKEDKLNRKEDSIFLRNFLIERWKLLKGEKGVCSFVLNVNADWGLGKTYFLTNWKEDLVEEDFLCIYFNAWETDFSSDPLIAFISEVETQLNPLIRKSSKAQSYLKDTVSSAKRLFKPSLPILLSILSKKLTGLSLEQLKNLVDEDGPVADFENQHESFMDDKKTAEDVVSKLVSISAEQALIEHDSTKRSILLFKKNLKKFLDHVEKNLKTKKLPLFIFVDELDRCRPTYAIELLETIKHLFGVDGVYFVIATDSKQLSHSIKAVYGNNFDSIKYLKRFFDLEYSFSAPNYESYSNHLFRKYGLTQTNKLFTPFDGILAEEIGVNAVPYLFAKCAQFFRLSLRDQEQVCSMLNIVHLTYSGSTIHVAYFLFLAILRHSFPRIFDDYSLVDNLNLKKGLIKPFLEDKNNNFGRLTSVKTINHEHSSKEENVLRLENIFYYYISISSESSDKLNSGNESNAIYHGICSRIFLDSKKYSEYHLGHDLGNYPTIVQRVGKFTVNSHMIG